MTNTLNHDFTQNLDLTGIVGPDITFTRASTAYVRDLLYYALRNVPVNKPRYEGAMISINELSYTDQLDNPAWTKSNCTVAQDATDVDGVANSAWTITDAATTSGHAIQQEIPQDNLAFYNRQIEVHAGTKRYVIITNNTAANITDPDEGGIFDTLTGEFTVSGTNKDNLAGGGIYDYMIQDLGDGWWNIGLISFVGTADDRWLTVGPANGPTMADASYLGDGTGTILVKRPFVIQISINRSAEPFPYNESTDTLGYGVYDNGIEYQFMNNSMWLGASNGTPPNGGYYGYEWTIPFSTGTGTSITSPISQLPPTRYRPAGTPQAINFIGTSQRYFLTHDLYYSGSFRHYSDYVFSIYVGDINVSTTEDIVTLTDWTSATGTLTAKLSDMDPVTRRIEMPFSMKNKIGLINIGLGIGGNDTADFVLHSPQLEEGSQATVYKPNDGTTSYGGDWKNAGPAPITGILFERESTNIVKGSDDILGSHWTPSANAGVGRYDIWTTATGLGNIASIKPIDTDPATGPLNYSQPITGISTSTRYTIRVEMVWWSFNTDCWAKIELANHGSQDIFAFINLKDTSAPFGYSVGSTGTNVIDVQLEESGTANVIARITFDSDVASTTGDLILHAAEGDGDLDILLDGKYFVAFADVQMEEGDPTSFIRVEDANPVTRVADVAKITDMSWYNDSAGTIYVDFIAPYLDDLSSPKTVWSTNDTTSTNRVSIEIGDGTDANLRLRIYDGTEQIVLTGPAISSKERVRVAVGYDEENPIMYVNGELAGNYPIYDNFNRPGPAVGSNWRDAVIDGWQLFDIKDSTVIGLTQFINYEAGFWDGVQLTSPDQFIEVDLVNWIYGYYDASIWLWLRATSGTDINSGYYCYMYGSDVASDPPDGSFQLDIYRWEAPLTPGGANRYTALGSLSVPTEQTIPDGTTFRFQAEGDVISAWIDKGSGPENVLSVVDVHEKLSTQTGVAFSLDHFVQDSGDVDTFRAGILNPPAITLPTVTQLNIGSNHADAEQVDSTIGQVWYDNTKRPEWEIEALSNGIFPSDITRPNTRIREVEFENRTKLVK